MIKKILIYLSICIGFIFAFFHGDKINILAYTEYDNTLGTYPVKVDYNNYDKKNILYLNDTTISSSVGCGVQLVYDFETDIFTLNGTVNTSNCAIFKDFFSINSSDLYYSTLNFYYVGGSTNNSYSDNTVNNYNLRIVLRNNDWSSLKNDVKIFNNNYNNNNISRIYNSTQNNGQIYFLDVHTGFNSVNNVTFNNYQFKLMFTNNENSYISDSSTSFESPFYLGNMIGYKFNIVNPTNSYLSTRLIIRNYDTIVLSTAFQVANGSVYELLGNVSTNSIGTNDTRFYLPYNYDNSGLISMDYRLSVELTNSNLYLINDENINNDSYFYFTPIFKAYYKGESTNNIYLKNSYVFNSITYTGFNSNGVYLNNVYFGCYGNVYSDYCLQSSLTVPANTSYNVLANNVIDTGIRNFINFKDVFIYDYEAYSITTYSTLFEFSVNIGQYNVQIENNSFWAINVSSINLNVINDSSTNLPLPNNPDTNNKYNVCDAWYDIPCQLGNAITYVIYEAPIISPIVEFITTFIDGLQYVITYIKWFESLGVVFSLFIFILMIRLLIMLIKGSNDDRGGNK